MEDDEYYQIQGKSYRVTSLFQSKIFLKYRSFLKKEIQWLVFLTREEFFI